MLLVHTSGIAATTTRHQTRVHTYGKATHQNQFRPMKTVNPSVPECLEIKPSHDGNAKIQTSGKATSMENGKRTRVQTSGIATLQTKSLKSNQTRHVLKKTTHAESQRKQYASETKS